MNIAPEHSETDMDSSYAEKPLSICIRNSSDALQEILGVVSGMTLVRGYSYQALEETDQPIRRIRISCAAGDNRLEIIQALRNIPGVIEAA